MIRSMTFVLGVPFGMAATALLFYFMAVVTDDNRMIVDQEVRTPKIDFQPTRMDETPRTKTRALPAPPEPALDLPVDFDASTEAMAAPDISSLPVINIPALAESHSMKGSMLVAIPGARTGAGGRAAGGRPQPTSDAIPLVRVPPQYPMRALMNRTEGWVLVVFTISESGAVQNPRVVQAEPPNLFDQAALRAVSRWKYAPRVINGQPQVRHGVRVVIDFEMADPPEQRR